MSGGKEDVQKTQRSVFVGNIPYEATEEQLKEIFEQVGPVVNFRIVYDRESGKPKGYGFCEYQDTETAKSAMRNLNDHDFHGRALRVGHAAGETSNAEKAVSQAITGPPEEPLYGEAVEPGKAPEAISRAVASLPPEQMFELMKQMKMCIQNNPNEARNMLLQNPQLAYALLQAQIVMKIVDPQVALAMLHRQSEQIPPLVPTSSEETPTTSKPAETVAATPQPAAPVIQSAPTTQATPQAPPAQPKLQDVDHRQHMQQPVASVPTSAPMNPGLPLTQTPTMPPAQMHGAGGPTNTPMGGGGGGLGLQTPTQQPPQRAPMGGGLQSMPQSAAMGGPSPMGGGGGGPSNQPPVMAMANTAMGGGGGPAPPRGGLLGDRPGPPNPAQFERNRGPGFMDRGGPGQGNHGMGPGQGNPGMGPGHGNPGMGPGQGNPGMGPGGPGFPPGGPGAPGGRSDPRDPRSGRMGPGGPMPGMGGPRPGGPGPNMGGPRPPISTPSANPPGAGSSITTQDQEKAQLIMQVLQLSDEQIAMLPPDQQQSILILKEQIAKSTN